MQATELLWDTNELSFGHEKLGTQVVNWTMTDRHGYVVQVGLEVSVGVGGLESGSLWAPQQQRSGCRSPGRQAPTRIHKSLSLPPFKFFLLRLPAMTDTISTLTRRCMKTINAECSDSYASNVRASSATSYSILKSKVRFNLPAQAQMMIETKNSAILKATSQCAVCGETLALHLI